MGKTTARILGMLVTVAALTAATPKVEAQKACTLLCIQGYHCCVQGNKDTCVPESQACK
jgi:hypothetical protein